MIMSKYLVVLTKNSLALYAMPLSLEAVTQIAVSEACQLLSHDTALYLLTFSGTIKTYSCTDDAKIKKEGELVFGQKIKAMAVSEKVLTLLSKFPRNLLQYSLPLQPDPGIQSTISIPIEAEKIVALHAIKQWILVGTSKGDIYAYHSSKKGWTFFPKALRPSSSKDGSRLVFAHLTGWHSELALLLVAGHSTAMELVTFGAAKEDDKLVQYMLTHEDALPQYPMPTNPLNKPRDNQSGEEEEDVGPVALAWDFSDPHQVTLNCNPDAEERGKSRARMPVLWSLTTDGTLLPWRVVDDRAPYPHTVTLSHDGPEEIDPENTPKKDDGEGSEKNDKEHDIIPVNQVDSSRNDLPAVLEDLQPIQKDQQLTTKSQEENKVGSSVEIDFGTDAIGAAMAQDFLGMHSKTREEMQTLKGHLLENEGVLEELTTCIHNLTQTTFGEKELMAVRKELAQAHEAMLEQLQEAHRNVCNWRHALLNYEKEKRLDALEKRVFVTPPAKSRPKFSSSDAKAREALKAQILDKKFIPVTSIKPTSTSTNQSSKGKSALLSLPVIAGILEERDRRQQEEAQLIKQLREAAIKEQADSTLFSSKNNQDQSIFAFSTAILKQKETNEAVASSPTVSINEALEGVRLSSPSVQTDYNIPEIQNAEMGQKDPKIPIVEVNIPKDKSEKSKDAAKKLIQKVEQENSKEQKNKIAGKEDEAIEVTIERQEQHVINSHVENGMFSAGDLGRSLFKTSLSNLQETSPSSATDDSPITQPFTSKLLERLSASAANVTTPPPVSMLSESVISEYFNPLHIHRITPEDDDLKSRIEVLDDQKDDKAEAKNETQDIDDDMIELELQTDINQNNDEPAESNAFVSFISTRNALSPSTNSFFSQHSSSTTFFGSNLPSQFSSSPSLPFGQFHQQQSLHQEPRFGSHEFRPANSVNLSAAPIEQQSFTKTTFAAYANPSSSFFNNQQGANVFMAAAQQTLGKPVDEEAASVFGSTPSTTVSNNYNFNTASNRPTFGSFRDTEDI